jgi:hypothetical protein
MDDATLKALRAAREADRSNLPLLQVLLDGYRKAGQLHLRAGRIQEPREHMQFALRLDPNDVGAIHLLAGIKAREGWLLGLWWRFNCWITAGGELRTVLLLLSLLAGYRLTIQILNDTGNDALIGPVAFCWLLFAASTWFGPAIFHRMVQREQEQVTLRKGF